MPKGSTLFRSDCKEMPVGPDVPAAVHQRGGGERPFLDAVHVQQLEGGPRLQHERLALIVREEHFAIDADGRRGESLTLRLTEPSLPHHAPGGRLERGDDACHVVDGVELLAVEQR